MTEKKKYSVIILAGGKSSRMGADKGLVEFNGKKMIEHILDVVKYLTDEILIVSNNPDYKNFGYPVVEDIYKECGPLGGIHAGLSKSTTPWNLVIGCDMPYVTSDFLEFLILQLPQSCDAIIPVHDEKVEPLCALFNRTSLPKMESLLLKNELKMQEVVARLNSKFVDVPMKHFLASVIFKNINSRIDLITS